MRHLKFWTVCFAVGCGCGWPVAVAWQRVRPKTIPEQVAERIEELKAPDWTTHYAAANALQKIGPEAAPAAPALAADLKDESGPVCAAVADALTSIGPGAAPAAPALAECLKDASSLVRMGAAEALGRIGHGAVSTAPRIAELLKDSNRDVRQSAAYALRGMGAAAAPAAPALAEALTDSESEVRDNAAWALWNIASSIGDNVSYPNNPALEKAAAGWTKIMLRPNRTPGKKTANSNSDAEALAAARFLGRAIQKEIHGH